jgi:hypothetical protein
MTEQPMTGQPMTGQPMTGQPMTGQPMTGQPMTGKKQPDRRTEGAVLVEFLIVFLPIFGFFLGIVQYMFIQVANLITGHAAQSAARAAMVVASDPLMPGTPGTITGARLEEIQRAARIPLSLLGVTRGDVNIALDRGSYGINEQVGVTVTVNYPCRVPLGNLIACRGATKTLTALGQMPNQGVAYEYR